MKKKVFTTISIALLFLVVVIGLWQATNYYLDLPNRISQHETIVLGQNRLVPGSTASLRVVTRDSKNAEPIENAAIRVSLQPVNGGGPILLYEGVTGEHGAADVVFKLPADAEPDQTLIVQTSSELGSDTIERSVTLVRDYKVLLVTDKPLYQPGQQIHIRTIALSAFDMIPAVEQEIEITIADGKGNKVFREAIKTSNWGIAAVDFRLASEVNTGAYKITASLGNTVSEKTVNVEHYLLPKFEVILETEKAFYLPGEHVKANLNANYFFGKPVAGGEVSIEGYTFDVARTDVISIQGITDETGRFEFEFDNPTYMAGTELEGGLARFYLQASVTDLAQHTEITNRSFPVSRDTLVIEAVPEGGIFKPGVENILYVLTSYPDGTPAETSLDIQFYNTGESVAIDTGPYGIAEVVITPNDTWQNLNIQARDSKGNASVREFYFEGQWDEETVLLRPQKPVYRVGDTLELTVLTSARVGTVYLDIIREGQTVQTRSVTITAGTTQVAVDLTPDLYGTLEIHAYKILRSGHITRDTRIIVVDQADALDLALRPGSDTYRPGESATVDIQVRNQDGVGVQSAIGLAVVDESVFALAESDPGFAKLYFMLENELMQPKYDLHGFSVPDLLSGVPEGNPDFVNAIEEAAQASLAETTPLRVGFSLEANSHDEAMLVANERQDTYFAGLSLGLFGVFGLMSVLFIIFSLVSLSREGWLGRGIVTAFGILVVPVLVLIFWPHPWADNPIDKLGVFFDWLSWSGEEILIILSLTAFLGWVLLIIVAVRRKDGLLGWQLGLIPVVLAVLVFMVFAVSEADIFPDEVFMVLGLVAYFLMVFSFLLRSSGFIWGKRWLPALAAFVVASFYIIVISPAFALGRVGMVQAQLPGEMFAGGPEVEMMALDMAAPTAEGSPRDLAEKSAIMEENLPPDEVDNSVISSVEPPRLRQYFPETMLWLPEAVTDETGVLQVEFPVADSITTWRMSALASTQDGQLGSATAPLRVFQDFFIDLDLPLALTVGDEVSVPVGVFNYLEESQKVRLVLEESDWFELLDKSEKEIQIEANDIQVVYFRIKATEFGQNPFKVTAWGSQMSDAILKDVRVFPDGKQIFFTQSDRLESAFKVEENIDIPQDAIPGTQQLIVKIYPGILSQVVEGLESILRMPYGCFEQTSSTTYPNVLVLDYLRFTDQVAPEMEFKAEEYINLGYQRLTTFEVGGSGGFSLFGDPPPDRMLTAYGLQEFSDMSRIHNVDPALVERAAKWLFTQQSGNGSWENDRGLVHENSWSNLGDDRLPVTAYIVWSLVDAGFGGDPQTQAGLAYIKENSSKAEDPYEVALIANALVAADISTGAEITDPTLALLDRLASMSILEGNGATWRSGVATFMGSEGQTGSIETTALAALAFLRANRYPELANAALTAIIQQKDSFGTWYSTQATVLSLKALIQSVRTGAEEVNAKVTVRLNEAQTRTVEIKPENFDVVQLLVFDDINIGRENVVDIQVEGDGNLMYQVSGSYYLPWNSLPRYPQLTHSGELLEIGLDYDRTEMVVNDTVGVNVTVTLKEGQAESALIDLGLPPGFSVETEDLAALVSRFNDVPEDYPLPTIERFELTSRQILIYVSNLTAEHPLEFSYRLRAKFPLAAQTPASNAYDYYNPEVSGEIAPLMLVVNP